MNTKKILWAILGAIIAIPLSVSALSVFTPSQGGTGNGNIPSYGQILVGNGVNYTLTATSSLGLPTFSSLNNYLTLSSWYATTTGGLTEGSNLYFTSARATTSFAQLLAATNTTALAEGSNLYFTNGRADARINATTSIGTLTDLPNLLRSTTTNATSTSFFATLLTSTTGTITNFFSTLATITGLTTTNSTSTNATSTNSFNTNLVATNATIGTETVTGSTITRSTTTNATTTNFAISSVVSKLLKTNATGGVVGATLGTDYVNGSGTSGNCVAWGASNALADAGSPCGSGSGGGSSQWATSTLYSNAIYTAGAQVVGIGTSTPWGSLTLSSTSPELWFHDEIASANQGLAWISNNKGILNFGTSTDAHATTSLLRLDGGTSTFSGKAITVGSGTYASSLVEGAGTSTMWGGINLANGGCFAVAGACMGSMALSGTVGQVNYYSGVNTAVGTSSLFIATSQNVGIGSTSPWAKLSIDTANALGTAPLFAVASSSLSMFVIDSKGRIGINNPTPAHRLDVKGRIAGQPMFDCMNLFLSQTNVTADQLGSATVASFACEGNMFIDVNTSNAGILALSSANVEAPMASGTPALQLLDASIATAIANNLVFLKTHVVGSATSSLGDGIAMQATIYTPKVSVATTSVTYVPLGFSDAAITSLTTTAAYALPSNGCLLVASSTPKWKLQCTKAGVVSLVDTGFATSTTAFKALLTIDSTGANVYFNGSTVSSANVAAANLPVVWLRPTVGVGLTGGVTPAQARLGIGNLQVWGQDKY